MTSIRSSSDYRLYLEAKSRVGNFDELLIKKDGTYEKVEYGEGTIDYFNIPTKGINELLRHVNSALKTCDRINSGNVTHDSACIKFSIIEIKRLLKKIQNHDKSSNGEISP